MGINVNLTKGATKAELDTLYAQTLTAKTAAELAETNAETAETNAGNSSTDAANSATASATSATASAASASAAAASEAGVDADRVAAAASAAAALVSEGLADADRVITNADVVLTHADVVLAEADKVQTGLDRAAVAADAIATAADAVSTAADKVATNADVVLTNADVLSAEDSQLEANDWANRAENLLTRTFLNGVGTNRAAGNYSTLHWEAKTSADAIATAADKVATNADAVSTAADVVLTNADAIATAADKVATNADAIATAADAVSTAADVVSSAANAASAAATYDGFDDRYLGSKAVAPTLDNDGNALLIGALYYDSVDTAMKVNTAAGWIATSSATLATMERYVYTATAAQTLFSGADDGANTLAIVVGAEMVTLNGIVLEVTADYTVTTSSITLTSGAALNDEVNIYAFGNFEVANHYSKTAADARFEPIDSAYTKAEDDARFLGLAGGTMTGDVSLGDNVKAKFGASDDLKIFHDGTNSYVQDNGAGGLAIQTNGSAVVIEKTDGENMLLCNVDGAVTAYHNGSPKLATTSTGIDVTGSVTCDGFTSTGIDDNATSTAITIDADEALTLSSSGAAYGKIGSSAGTYIASLGCGLRLHSGGTKIFPTTATGGALAGTVDLGAGGAEWKDLYLSGDVKVASGKGIDFSSDPNYSGTTSELLDDYEYGEFTPVIGDGTYTLAYAEGRYSKVGNMVTIHIGLKISAASSLGTASASISGLPFAASASGGYQEPHQNAPNGNMVTSVPSLSFFVSSTTLFARNSGTNGDTVLTSANLWTANSFLKYQLTYWV